VGSGGTSVSAFVQTTLDGSFWFDIASFLFGTVSLTNIFNLVASVAIVGTPLAPVTGALLAQFNGRASARSRGAKPIAARPVRLRTESLMASQQDTLALAASVDPSKL
jgi:hypothetical protein